LPLFFFSSTTTNNWRSRRPLLNIEIVPPPSPLLPYFFSPPPAILYSPLLNPLALSSFPRLFLSLFSPSPFFSGAKPLPPKSSCLWGGLSSYSLNIFSSENPFDVCRRGLQISAFPFSALTFDHGCDLFQSFSSFWADAFFSETFLFFFFPLWNQRFFMPLSDFSF